MLNRFASGVLLICLASTAYGVDLAEIQRRCVGSICRVVASEGNSQNVGTGCLVADRWVLTADHVVGNRPAVVQFRTEEIRVIERWNDMYADAALCRLASTPKGAKPIPMATSEPVGEVVMIGFDRGNTQRLRFFEGRLANRTYTDGTLSFIPVRAGAAVSGNSGGPVLNSAGELVSNLHSTGVMEALTFANSNKQCRSFVKRVSQKTDEVIIDWGGRPDL